MDFELNAEQRAWQSKARAFAEEEIRPLSLAREALRRRCTVWQCIGGYRWRQVYPSQVIITN